jgi:tRNA-dihydrouridine synthase
MFPIYFAPLQGFTEDTYRRIHHELIGGVASYYTPFLRMEHKGIRTKDARDVRPDFNAGVPVCPQVIAKDGAEFTFLINYLTDLGYREIDVNMGCPFPLQTRHGRGAGLLQNSACVKEITNIIRQHKELTFSIKMRLGQTDASEGLSLLPILNATPLKHITLHPRLGIQQYNGVTDLDAFQQFAEQCDHPLIYNGDLRTPSDVHEIMRRFPNLSGVMIGRGLLARPSLAREIADGTEWQHSQRLSLVKKMHEHYHAHLSTIIPSEAQLLRKVRTFWEYLEEECGRKAWKKIMKAGSMHNYLNAINELN